MKRMTMGSYASRSSREELKMKYALPSSLMHANHIAAVLARQSSFERSIVALLPDANDVVVGAGDDVETIVADRQVIDDHLLRLAKRKKRVNGSQGSSA